MDRELWQRPTIIQIDAQPLLTGSSDDFDALQQMFNAFYIDEAVLRERIDFLLRFSGEVTLQALLTLLPTGKRYSGSSRVSCAGTEQRPTHHYAGADRAVTIERYADHQPVTLHLPRVTLND